MEWNLFTYLQISFVVSVQNLKITFYKGYQHQKQEEMYYQVHFYCTVIAYK